VSEKSVLIVEDEPDNRDILCSVVQDIGGYQASAVADGEQALSAVVSNKPDLILLDLILPGLDGFEVARRLKGDPSTQSIPILAISALARSGDRDQALTVGCDDYIDKPFSLDELVAKIDRLLGSSSTSSR
jgi:CheY-like chemotaxis protein